MYRRIYAVTYIFVAMFFLKSVLYAADEETLSVRILSAHNLPYIYQEHEQAEPKGIAYEIVDELMKRAGIFYKLEIMPWRRAQRILHSSTDTCFFIMNRTPAREVHYKWVGPLIIGGLVIYKRPGDPATLNSLEDLRGKIVMGKTDSAGNAGLNTKYGAVVVTFQTDREAAATFYKGRGDFWAGGKIGAPLIAKSLNLPLPEPAFIRKEVDLSMGCSVLTSDTLIQKMNAANASLGSLKDEIIQNFTLPYTPFTPSGGVSISK